MKIEDYNYGNFANHLEFLKIDYQTFRKLRTLERKCNQIALQLNNCPDFTIPDDWSEKMVDKVKTLCPGLRGQMVFINLDPIGYALKVKNPSLHMYRDFGGYGIVAPEF